MRDNRHAWKLRIRLRERAMLELLWLAVDATRAADISLVAHHVLLALLCRPDRRVVDERLIYREAASLLRDQCVRLGVPAERYATDEWLALGLGLPVAA